MPHSSITVQHTYAIIMSTGESDGIQIKHCHFHSVKKHFFSTCILLSYVLKGI